MAQPHHRTAEPAPAPTEPQVKVAGFWRRLVSNAIDLLILLLPAGLISPLLTPSVQIFSDLIVGGVPHEYRLMVEIGVFLFFHLVILLNLAFTYFLVFEASPLRATPGKLALRISVQGAAGTKASFFRTIFRNLLKPLSLAVFGLGILMIPITKKKQALHDKLTRTLVARFESPTIPALLYSGLAFVLVLGTVGIALPSSRKQLSQNREIAEVKYLPLSLVAQRFSGNQKVASDIAEQLRRTAAQKYQTADFSLFYAAMDISEPEFLETPLSEAIANLAKDEVQWHLGELPSSSKYYETHELVYVTFKLPNSLPVKLQFLSERDGEWSTPYTSYIGDQQVEPDEILIELWKQAALTIWASAIWEQVEDMNDLPVRTAYGITGYLYAGLTPEVYAKIVHLQTSDQAEANHEELQALVRSGKAVHLTPGSVAHLEEYMPDQNYPELCSVRIDGSDLPYFLKRSWLSQSLAGTVPEGMEKRYAEVIVDAFATSEAPASTDKEQVAQGTALSTPPPESVPAPANGPVQSAHQAPAPQISEQMKSAESYGAMPPRTDIFERWARLAEQVPDVDSDALVRQLVATGANPDQATHLVKAAMADWIDKEFVVTMRKVGCDFDATLYESTRLHVALSARNMSVAREDYVLALQSGSEVATQLSALPVAVYLWRSTMLEYGIISESTFQALEQAAQYSDVLQMMDGPSL
jgi:uncharacterized RDD family membrane protein YckC